VRKAPVQGRGPGHPLTPRTDTGTVPPNLRPSADRFGGEVAIAASERPAIGVVARPGLPAVRLEAVTKRFGDGMAVGPVDLDIPDGEFFSMLGPSGSGKTTTLRMIAGFELPTSGRILLHGEDVTRRPPFERDVNTVFQDYALFPHMSVAQNVA